ENRWLLIWDTGERPSNYCEDKISYGCNPRLRDRSVGMLRNLAASDAHEADILIHWDDDDYSHPNRIAEQVALLQSSGAECVGYREMLFCDTRLAEFRESEYTFQLRPRNEAWIYKHGHPKYCLGTSMCYWREVWERRPFPDRTVGEDGEWLFDANGW